MSYRNLFDHKTRQNEHLTPNIMTYNIDKYSDPDRKKVLSKDFNRLAQWMRNDQTGAAILEGHINMVASPRRTIAENPENVFHLNKVISFCNKVLSGELGEAAKNNAELRTSIRRIKEFSETITEPLDCNKRINIVPFNRRA